MDYVANDCVKRMENPPKDRKTIKDTTDYLNGLLNELNSALEEILITLSGDCPSPRDKQEETCFIQSLNIGVSNAKAALETALRIRGILI